MSRVLYIIACAAPPAREINRLIEPAQEAGWDVCVLATPSATKFIDSAALEKRTGHPVRSDYKEPGTEDVLPPPDAIIVAPGNSKYHQQMGVWNMRHASARHPRRGNR